MANLAIIEKIEAISEKPGSKFMRALAAACPQASPVLPPALVRQALTVIKNSESLQKASEFSLFNSIAEVAQMGLSLDIHLGQAFLVPFSGQCTVIYGYKGLIELARRSGQIAEIAGEIRYAKDNFRLTLGSAREIIHVPADVPLSKRGAMVGAYAIAEFSSGKVMFEYMDADQILAIKNGVLKRKKPGGKPSPWETQDEAEMWRKTPIRRLSKRMPQSPSLIPFVQAAIRDEYRQQGHFEPLQHTQGVAEALDSLELSPAPPSREKLQEQEPKTTIKADKAASKEPISQNEADDLYTMICDAKLDVPSVFKHLGHKGKLTDLPKGKLADAIKFIEANTKGRKG